jgi:electron transfer flavoprotein beta subunit
MALGRRMAGDGLRVVHAGAEQEPSLQDYLALGAGTIEVLPLDSSGDAVAALAAYLKDVDVILTGSNADSGAGSGLFPYVLARALARPVVANVLEARVERAAGEGWDVEIRQFLPKGERRRIGCELPLVIAVHPLAPVELKYAYARRVSGRVERGPEIPTGTRVVEPGWAIEAASRRPVRLKARETKSAHARMQAAVVAEAKGGVVAFGGSTVDKAQVMLNYLREHRLVDF